MLVNNLHRVGDGVSEEEWERLTAEWVKELKTSPKTVIPLEDFGGTRPFRMVGFLKALEQEGGQLVTNSSVTFKGEQS